MFQKASKQKLVVLMAPIGLAVSLSFSAVSANAAKYVTSGFGESVVNSYSECWQAMGGVPNCGPAKKGMSDSDGDGVADANDECPNTPKGVAVTSFGCPKDTDGDGVADYLDKCAGTPPNTKVNAEGCEMVASMTINTTTAHFDFDSARLKPAMMSELDKVAAQLNASAANESVAVVGHTDSIGSKAYNQSLSKRRAQSVAAYLSTKGIGNMSVTGMGESSPVASNATREGRAKNRRVEINTK